MLIIRIKFNVNLIDKEIPIFYKSLNLGDVFDVGQTVQSISFTKNIKHEINMFFYLNFDHFDNL